MLFIIPTQIIQEAKTESKRGVPAFLWPPLALLVAREGDMKEQSGGGRTNGVPVPQLALLRKQAGLSQRALAERARVSRQTINRLEHGANARYDTLTLLTQALKVPPTRLIRSPRQRGSQALSISPEC